MSVFVFVVVELSWLFGWLVDGVFVFVVFELCWLFGWLVECVRGEFKLKERISDLGQSHYQLESANRHHRYN